MYQLIITESVIKDLRSVPKVYAQKIDRKIRGLSVNPRPNGYTKLKGRLDTYRLRQGDYRIIYTIEDQLVVVRVIKVGHRKDVYGK